MKKTVLILKIILATALIASTVLMLSADIFYLSPSRPPVNPNGDGDEFTDTDSQKPGDNTSTERPEKPDTSIPDWTIRPVVVRNTIKDKKGKILCETRYTYPSVSSNDGSDISEFYVALAKIESSVRSYVNARSDIYKLGVGGDFSVPPQITGYYTVNRFSSEIFSISFIFSETAPDGTLVSNRFSYNLDLQLDSSNITIDAIMNDGAKEIGKLLEKKAADEKIALYENYEKLLPELLDSVWSVEAHGIRFSFPTGTIAPSSSGEIEILLDRASLSSVLSEYGKILLNISN